MKKILTTIFSLVAAATLFAQVPQSFSFQAVMRDNNNTLMTNQIVSAKFTITPNDNSDVITYCETHSLTTDANGILRAEVGKGTPCGGRFDQIRWEQGGYLLNCRFDYSAVPEEFASSTTQFLSVPYAIVSDRASTSADFELFYTTISRSLDTVDELLTRLQDDIRQTDSLIRVLRSNSNSPIAPTHSGDGSKIAEHQSANADMKKEKSITIK